ncbi:MAG: SusD/RagB family nutrient-binding outer membrane lipoprotein [Cyclonatronaceae bacterium]
MKINFLKISSMLLAVLLMAGACDDFLSVNENPNLPSEVPPENRILGAIRTTNGAAMWRGTREVSAVTQYGTTRNTTGGYHNAETWRFSSAYFFWQNSYTWALPNAVDLIRLGEADGSPHFIGVGKTLQALIFGMLTDQYGPIVVSDAYDGISQVELTPEFDPQDEVYETILRILDEAIEAFRETENNTPLNLTGGDVLYEGDIEKWERFAWSLKARYLNHLSRKSSMYDSQAIIEAANNGFNADGMDAEFNYSAGSLQTEENPFYSWGGFTNPDNPRFFTWSQFYVDLLTTFPVTNNEYQDPRISRIMQPAPSDSVYRGLRSGMGLEGGQGGSGEFTDPEDYGRFSDSGYYTSIDSPFPFITYGEVKLIEAEARLRSGDGPGALAAYEEGVRAHMRKVGVTATEIEDYWSAQEADGVAAHFGDLTQGLSHIMRQKYIAQTLNPETWVDMRRMDYSQDIYGPSLQRPANLNTIIFDPNDETDWIRAMVYEGNEEVRNPDNVGDNTPAVRLRYRVWWDRDE